MVSIIDYSLIQVNKKVNLQLGRLKKYIVNIHQKNEENNLQSKIDIYIHCNEYVLLESKICAPKKRANETYER